MTSSSRRSKRRMAQINQPGNCRLAQGSLADAGHARSVCDRSRGPGFDRLVRVQRRSNRARPAGCVAGGLFHRRPSLGSAVRELGERVPANGRLRDCSRPSSFRRDHPNRAVRASSELVDADPRSFADQPDAPWPVRRGGWILASMKFSRASRCPAVLAVLGGTRLRRLGRISQLTRYARPAARRGDRLPHVIQVLVRIVPELAKRIPVGGGDGLACGVSASARLTGIQAGSRSAWGNRTLIRRERARRRQPLATVPHGWRAGRVSRAGRRSAANC